MDWKQKSISLPNPVCLEHSFRYHPDALVSNILNQPLEITTFGWTQWREFVINRLCIQYIAWQEHCVYTYEVWKKMENSVHIIVYGKQNMICPHSLSTYFCVYKQWHLILFSSTNRYFISVAFSSLIQKHGKTRRFAIGKYQDIRSQNDVSLFGIPDME